MQHGIPRVRSLESLFACLLMCAFMSGAAFADGGHDRTQVGHSISIGPEEEVSEATCFGCSIRVRGHVDGDVTAFGGSVVVEDQGVVGGDTTVFGGDLRLDSQVKVSGDVTVFGGRLRRDAAATVGGEVTNFGGAGWMLLIFVLPLLLLGAFVGLIVWLVWRLVRPAAPAPA